MWAKTGFSPLSWRVHMWKKYFFSFAGHLPTAHLNECDKRGQHPSLPQPSDDGREGYDDDYEEGVVWYSRIN